MRRKVTEETSIKMAIKQYLAIKGWYYFYFLQGLGSFPGICDIIAVKNGVTLFIEVKTPKGKLSAHQKLFKENIERAGGVFVVARSVDDIISAIKNVEGK